VIHIWYALARGLMACGQFGAAEAYLRRCVRHNPNHVAAQINLGWVCSQLGRRREAADAYTAVIRIAPSWAEGYCRLGCVLQQLQQHEAAVTLFQRAIELSGGDAFAEFNLGVSLTAVGRLQEALFAYRRAVAIDPADAEAAANLGVTLGTLGEDGEAVYWCERAFTLKPTSNSARNLAMILSDLDRFAQAEQRFRDALRLGPASDEFHVDITINLARVLAEQDKYEEAIGVLKQLADDGFDSVHTRSTLSGVLLMEGRTEEARAAAASALSISPESPTALVAMGWVHLQTHEYVEALWAFQRAEMTTSLEPSMLVGKASALTGLKRYAEAMQVFDEAFTKDPRALKRFPLYEPYYLRARAANAPSQAD
jgi:tetratricopeptide (TPR) repeat protein